MSPCLLSSCTLSPVSRTPILWSPCPFVPWLHFVSLPPCSPLLIPLHACPLVPCPPFPLTSRPLFLVSCHIVLCPLSSGSPVLWSPCPFVPWLHFVSLPPCSPLLIPLHACPLFPFSLVPLSHLQPVLYGKELTFSRILLMEFERWLYLVEWPLSFGSVKYLHREQNMRYFIP
jgi:hypothetical protein